jgi:hypothetical protein
MNRIPIPREADCPAYFFRYINYLHGRDPEQALREGLVRLKNFSNLTETELDFRYAPGKWSIRQVLGHIADTEMIFTYRMLRISRKDQTPLAGFEQDDYAASGAYDTLTGPQLIDLLVSARMNSLALCAAISGEAWEYHSLVNNNQVTAKSLPYITAGHQLHHERILRELYHLSI